MNHLNDRASTTDTGVVRFRPRLRRHLSRLCQRFRERSARRALMALDDRLLGDIGLTRSDLSRDLDQLAAERAASRAPRVAACLRSGRIEG